MRGSRSGAPGHALPARDHRVPRAEGIMAPMDWIRSNFKTIALIVALAMLFPFLLILLGIAAF